MCIKLDEKLKRIGAFPLKAYIQVLPPIYSYVFNIKGASENNLRKSFIKISHNFVLQDIYWGIFYMRGFLFTELGEDYTLTSFYTIFNGEEEVNLGVGDQWHWWTMIMIKAVTHNYTADPLSEKITLWSLLSTSLQWSKMIFN